MGTASRDGSSGDVVVRVEKTASGTQCTVYENEVPPFVEAEMERLYKSLYSSMSYFRACVPLDNVSTCVLRRDGVVSAVFLFVRNGRKVSVMNEGMRLAADDVSSFVRHVFAIFSGVNLVAFHAVSVDAGGVRFAHQRFFCAEDFIVELPRTVEAYLASMGAATRKNIRRHRNRIVRDFPSFRFECRDGADADIGEIRAIIELNHARMAKKKKTSSIDEAVTQEIIRLVRECGELYVASIDGRLCAGTILYRVGDSCISRVQAHDPRYDGYRLGMVCCFLAICDCIEKGGRRFHLGQGKYEYKTALLGVFHGFDHVDIYRSRMHMLMNAATVWRTSLAGYSLRANRWLLHGTENGKTVFWDVARKALGVWRMLKSASRQP